MKGRTLHIYKVRPVCLSWAGLPQKVQQEFESSSGINTRHKHNPFCDAVCVGLPLRGMASLQFAVLSGDIFFTAWRVSIRLPLLNRVVFLSISSCPFLIVVLNLECTFLKCEPTGIRSFQGLHAHQFYVFLGHFKCIC